MSFLKASFFVKNVPPVERAVRTTVAIAGVTLSFLLLSPPLRWLGASSALMLGITGIVGFCPMCALAGRRLDRSTSA